MRDALSLLDRLMASGEKKLTVPLLEDLLGLPDRELIGQILDATTDGDPAKALAAGGALLDKGISADQLLESLLDRLRDLMVLAACGPETDLVELSGAARKAEAERAQRFDAAGLMHMIVMTEHVQRSLKSSSVPRALLDALLVRLAMTEKMAEVTGLVLSGGARAGKA
jgi:DNA polymerase-3 subunit gamma/tau